MIDSVLHKKNYDNQQRMCEHAGIGGRTLVNETFESKTH